MSGEQFKFNFEMPLTKVIELISEYEKANEGRRSEILGELIDAANNNNTKPHMELLYAERVGLSFRVGFSNTDLVLGILKPEIEKDRVAKIDAEEKIQLIEVFGGVDQTTSRALYR